MKFTNILLSVLSIAGVALADYPYSTTNYGCPTECKTQEDPKCERGIPDDNLFVALPPNFFDDVNYCDDYVVAMPIDVAKIDGPYKMVKAKVVDQCGTCASTQIDLSQPAFKYITEKEHGWTYIIWAIVSKSGTSIKVEPKYKTDVLSEFSQKMEVSESTILDTFEKIALQMVSGGIKYNKDWPWNDITSSSPSTNQEENVSSNPSSSQVNEDEEYYDNNNNDNDNDDNYDDDDNGDDDDNDNYNDNDDDDDDDGDDDDNDDDDDDDGDDNDNDNENYVNNNDDDNDYNNDNNGEEEEETVPQQVNSPVIPNLPPKRKTITITRKIPSLRKIYQKYNSNYNANNANPDATQTQSNFNNVNNAVPDDTFTQNNLNSVNNAIPDNTLTQSNSNSVNNAIPDMNIPVNDGENVQNDVNTAPETNVPNYNVPEVNTQNNNVAETNEQNSNATTENVQNDNAATANAQNNNTSANTTSQVQPENNNNEKNKEGKQSAIPYIVGTGTIVTVAAAGLLFFVSKSNPRKYNDLKNTLSRRRQAGRV